MFDGIRPGQLLDLIIASGEKLEGLLNAGPSAGPDGDLDAEDDNVAAGLFLNEAGDTAESRCVNSSSCVFTITFSGGNDHIRVNKASGHVEVALDVPDGTETPIPDELFRSIWLALDTADGARETGTVPTTEETISLREKSAAEPVFTSLKLDLAFRTSDQAGGTPNGWLDGVDIEVGHAITNDLGDNHGVVLVDLDPPADADKDTVASTTSIVSAEDGIVRVTANTQASISAISGDPLPEGDLSDLTTDRTSSSEPAIPYSLRIMKSTIMYAHVYDVSTGGQATIPDQGAGVVIVDGAAPIIQSAEFRPGESKNTLRIGVSENIKMGPEADFETSGFRIGMNEANSLQIDILNLDDGIGAAEIVGVDGGSAFTISNVTALDFEADAAPRLFLDASLESNIVGDVDNEELIGASGGTEITEGGTTLDDPEIQQVFAMRNAEGDFVSVVVVMTHMVDEVADGMPGTWTVMVEVGKPGPDDDISVVFRQVEVAGDNNVVTLRFPKPINGKVGITGGTLDFAMVDADDDGVPESGIKRVPSGTEEPTYLRTVSGKEIEGLPRAGGTDAIFAQKVTGQVMGDGVGSAVVHASVVMPMTVPAAGPNSVCTVRQENTDYTSQLGLASDADRSIMKAIRAGQRDVGLILKREDTDSGPKLSLLTPDFGGGAYRLPVSLSIRTGTVTGRGVSNCRLDLVQSLMVASNPSVATLNGEGKFETVVGVNENITHGANGNSADVTGCIFLTLEGMEFDGDGNFVRRGAVNLTSCDPAVGSPEEDGNYLAFSPSVSGGQPAGAHIEVNLDQLDSFRINPGAEWQLAALAGAHRAKSDNSDALVPQLFVCAGLNDDGAFDGPVSIVDDEGNLDELFSLNANGVRSFIEITETTVFNDVKNRDIGNNFAFAFRQKGQQETEGDSTTTEWDTGECSYLLNEDADGGFDLGRGWTLAKIGNDCGEEVTAVIFVDAGEAKIVINDEDNSDAVNAALAADADASVAFIYSPQGREAGFQRLPSVSLDGGNVSTSQRGLRPPFFLPLAGFRK